MIQYIASDLDGTLIPDNTKEINPMIYELIKQLKEKNVRFIAASGRQYQSIRRLFAPVQDDISYIAENGSLCIHNGQVITKGEISHELGLRIIQASHEYSARYRKCHNLVSCESHHYTDSRDYHFIHHMRDIIRNDIEVVDDLSAITEPFLKLAICDFEGTAKLAPFLKEKFSSEIRTATAGRIWVDFIAPNANKGTALTALLNFLGIDPADGIVFGDQYNDVDMLKLAGTSYAMATAAPGVEAYADKITDSVPDVLLELLNTI